MKIGISLSLCICMLSLFSYGQDCKYSVNKTDALTGQKILKAKIKINFYNEMDFYRAGDDLRIESIVYMQGKQNFELPAGAQIDIKLGNDKVLTLATVQPASSTSYVSSEQIYTVFGMSYSIDKAQAAEIIRYGIKYSRTHLDGDRYYEHSFSERETEKTRVSADCVFNEGKGIAKAPELSVPSTRPAPPKKDDEKEGSLIEDMMRKKKEKKAREETEAKVLSNPTPAKPVSKDSAKATAMPQPSATPAKAATPANPATQANTPPPVQVVPLSGADELMKWKKLLDQGIITKEEFEVQKKKILGN